MAQLSKSLRIRPTKLRTMLRQLIHYVSIRAGSNFSTTRNPVPGKEWKTAVIDTDINGRALFFKSIARQEHVEHSDFRQVPLNLRVAQAVKLLEK